LAPFVLANELPYVPGMEVNIGTGNVKTDRGTLKPAITKEPVWKGLERMVLSDRQNSHINIELEMNASQQALDMARNIEDLWNSGKYNVALEMFPELAKITNVNEMAIGNAWKVPIETQAQGGRWGNDVRIGNRDSVEINALDIHRASGNLFVPLLYTGDGYPNCWCFNWSTNGGLSWSETYNWWAGYDLKSVSTSVVGNFCHVAFGRGSAQDQAFLYRFNCATGAQTNFNNGSSYVTVFTTTSPDSILEVALTSNQDYYNNRLYYLAITKNGNLRFFWDDTGATSWTEVPTNVNYANHGLDASCNEGFATYYIWASYISNNDSIHIDANSSGDVWTKFLRYPVGNFGDYTAIGAWRDTIITVFDFMGASLGYVRYLTSYNGGSNWFWGVIGDSTNTEESPDVACRGGAGQGVVYRYYTPTRQERYTWRAYAGGWPAPVSIADYEPYYDKPSIEYLGSNRYGVVYTRWTGPNQACYFDRSDWTGIVENKTENTISRFISLAPNPSNGLAKFSYVTKQQGNVKISLYDASGRLVNNLINETKPAGTYTLNLNNQELPNGIYFIRVETTEGMASKTMTIVR